MKKYIFPLLAFALLSTQSWGQTKPTEAQTELNAYMDDGLVTFKSQDGQYSFRVGGRLAVDGAYYIDDYTDRSSGADLSSARIRIFSKLGSKLDVKFDISLPAYLSKTLICVGIQTVPAFYVSVTLPNRFLLKI